MWRLPEPNEADEHGIVCAGAAPEPELLLEAYYRGIFPWPHDGLPLLWFSPDPRFVIRLPDDVHIGKSLKKAMKATSLIVKADTNFAEVIRECAKMPRPGQDGTWIDDDMMQGYTALHHAGYAHSIEVYEETDGHEKLVGGLYGVTLGQFFCGESMFAQVDNASKIGFATFLAQATLWGFQFIDCQVHTDHLERFGAQEIPRHQFLSMLETARSLETSKGHWSVDITPQEALDAFK